MTLISALLLPVKVRGKAPCSTLILIEYDVDLYPILLSIVDLSSVPSRPLFTNSNSSFETSKWRFLLHMLCVFSPH